MTVGLSNSWTSDVSFETSDLLIYVMTYIGGFRLRAEAAGHAIQYVTRRTGISRTELYLGYSSVTT